MFRGAFMMEHKVKFEEFLEYLEQECMKGSGDKPLTRDQILNVIRRTWYE